MDFHYTTQSLCPTGTAPSGANHQPWHFACVSNPAVKKAIREAAENVLIPQAATVKKPLEQIASFLD